MTVKLFASSSRMAFVNGEDRTPSPPQTSTSGAPCPIVSYAMRVPSADVTNLVAITLLQRCLRMLGAELTRSRIARAMGEAGFRRRERFGVSAGQRPAGQSSGSPSRERAHQNESGWTVFESVATLRA